MASSMASHLSRDAEEVKTDLQHCPRMRKQKMERTHKTPRMTEDIPQRKPLDGAQITVWECALRDVALSKTAIRLCC